MDLDIFALLGNDLAAMADFVLDLYAMLFNFILSLTGGLLNPPA